MLLVDPKPLIACLNGYCREALEHGVGVCVSRGHYEVGVEHLLLKLLDDAQSDIPLLLLQHDVNIERVRHALDRSLAELPRDNNGRPTLSPQLLELIQDAWLVASMDLQETTLRSGALLLAFIARASFGAETGVGNVFKTLDRHSIIASFHDTCAASIEQKRGAAESPADARASSGNTALTKYCENFTEKARDGQIDPVFGRDAEIRQMIDILARRRKNNPLCIGEPGVGKTAVVEGLALRIAHGDVPECLRDVSLLGLDLGALQAGASVKGEFENRLKSVVNEIRASVKPIILFIDEAHMLIGAGAPAGGSDAANLFKPALARGELRTIAATTWAEYRKYFEKDAALARRFQVIKLHEPDTRTAVEILRGLRMSYERAHEVCVLDEAIIAAVKLSQRYIPGRKLPDKAIDLLDTACARVKVWQGARPDQLHDIQQQIQALLRERQGLERDREYQHEGDPARLDQITHELTALRARESELDAQWRLQREAANSLQAARQSLLSAREAGADEAHLVQLRESCAIANEALRDTFQVEPMVRLDVDPDVIGKVVSDWTGIPLGKIQRDQAQQFARLDDILAARIHGQDHAVHTIAETLKGAVAGLKEPCQPLGVFLLSGPSGVGKTETAMAVADTLFGSEGAVVTINMSEYQERHSVSRLIGSPPGYVGYGDGGLLTEAVRQRPYCVVLLDEVEKAHPDIMNLFYQVFDKGVLTDGDGKEIDFSNTAIFMTSNLAADVIMAATAGGQGSDLDALERTVRPILSKHFKPALLARMTVIPYRMLAPDAIADIVRRKLDRIAQRVSSNNGMSLRYSDAVIEAMVARCSEVDTGARNIDFIVRGTLMPMLSRQIIARMTDPQLSAYAYLDVGVDGPLEITWGVDESFTTACVDGAVADSVDADPLPSMSS